MSIVPVLTMDLFQCVKPIWRSPKLELQQFLKLRATQKNQGSFLAAEVVAALKLLLSLACLTLVSCLCVIPFREGQRSRLFRLFQP